MWHQRSRAKWLMNGDRNTKYYHLKTVTRRRKNNIVMLKDENGHWIEDIDQLQRMANDFYIKLFSEDNIQREWHQTAITYPVIANDVMEKLAAPITQEEVWRNPSLISEVNHTDICLIPKITHLEYVKQFRPISLCNTNYKIVSKVVVERLKGCVTNLVSPFQTGFVPGRNIHENIVVVKEMMHSMHRMNGKKGFFAIKVDLAKAYDK
ncbi:hypothetical protein A2U01_0024860, partial [Trifolium medium]|nr:hypothetical protein [Trifolium medium]